MIIEPIALAIANRVRGAQGSSGLNKPLLSIVFTLCAMSLGVSELWASAAGVAMFLAMKPSWGEQIGAYGGWSTERKTDWLTGFLLSPFTLSDKMWGLCGLVTRGLYFVVPLMIAQLWIAAALVPFSFALSYVIGVEYEKRVLKREGWEVGEYVFGLILGSLMLIS